MTSPSTDCISIRLWADKETALLIDCGIQLFMDEQVVPLEKKLITVVNSVTAKEEKLPALHSSHVRDINFLEYTLPTCKGEEVDIEWLESLQIINDDLHWLLSQSHWLFWSQVVFDMSLQKFLDSYLRLAPRPHDQLNLKYQSTHRRLIEEVNRRVFMVFLRLSTHKENKEHFISPDVFGDILYQHFLFDIPKMFDLCSIYGQENSVLLGKMISNIFTNQRRYSQDLMASIDSTYELLDQLVANVCSGKGSDTLQPLDSAQLAPSNLTDWILFVADVFNTLHIFLLVHVPSCCVLQGKNFAQRLAGYYDCIIPILQDKWRLLKGTLSHDNWIHLKFKLRAAKKNMVSIVHQLLTHCFVNADASVNGEETTSTSRSGKTNEKLWENFLSVVTVLITEKSFLREFEKHYSIEQLISSMKKHHSSFDEANFAYITEALQAKKPDIPEVKSSAASSHDPPPVLACSNPSDITSEDVQSVKELFPHLEISHIEKLITSYHGDTSAVIDAILEGKTDVGNHDNSGTGKYKIEEHNDVTAVVAGAETKSLLSARSNVYDHDEFDVFHQGDIDLSRVHIGKKFDVAEASHLLDDKSEVDALKKRITLDNFDPYEDEYDDTYDTHNVGAADADSADEMLSVKRLNEKGLFAAHFENEVDSNEEDQENVIEDHRTTTNVPTDDIPHNKGSNQNQPKWSRGSHQPRGSRDQFKKSTHMTDRPAHNDNSSQRGRVLKERHKGSHANHNRKDRAQQKMRKGMF